MKFMITRCRTRARLVASPRDSVTVVELLSRAFFVGVVPRRKDGSRNRIQQLGSRFRTDKVGAARNVARADQNGIAAIGRRSNSMRSELQRFAPRPLSFFVASPAVYSKPHGHKCRQHHDRFSHLVRT